MKLSVASEYVYIEKSCFINHDHYIVASNILKVKYRNNRLVGGCESVKHPPDVYIE